MLKTAFLPILLISVFLAGVRCGCSALNPDPSGAQPKMHPLRETGPASRWLLANRIETEKSIVYGTDPSLEREMDKQIKDEKKKEDKAWEMLQHMNIYKGERKRRPPAPPKESPQQ